MSSCQVPNVFAVFWVAQQRRCLSLMTPAKSTISSFHRYVAYSYSRTVYWCRCAEQNDWITIGAAAGEQTVDDLPDCRMIFWTQNGQNDDDDIACWWMEKTLVWKSGCCLSSNFNCFKYWLTLLVVFLRAVSFSICYCCVWFVVANTTTQQLYSLADGADGRVCQIVTIGPLVVSA